MRWWAPPTTHHQSLYAKDPDGIELEVCWVVPAALMGSVDAGDALKLRPLDLASEIDRYGPDTPGGLAGGVTPAAAPAP